MKVLVIGSLNIDLFARVDRFPKEGETLLSNGFAQKIGGKGANQASAIHRQGVDVTLWGCVGTDPYGSYITEQIKQLGINSVISCCENNTGLALIETDRLGRNRIVLVSGANGEFSVEHAKKHLSILDDHDIIVMQFEIPLSTVEFLAEESKKRGKIVVLNPAPALPVSDSLLNNTDYIIPNEHELSILTKMPTLTIHQVEQATRNLQKKVLNPIVTLGEKGVFFITNNVPNTIPAYSMHAVDTTGAGDSFIGGFVGALAKNYSIEEAVIYANKVAAISVTREGAFNIAGTEKEVSEFTISSDKKNIALICSTGIMASTLSQKLNAVFHDKYHIEATSVELLEGADEYDLVFLSPQFAYLEEEISHKTKAIIKILPVNLYNIFHIKELEFIINQLLGE